MASSTGKGEEATEYVESGPKQQNKAGRHCRRFWWVWLVAFCLLVLVVMIIVLVFHYTHWRFWMISDQEAQCIRDSACRRSERNQQDCLELTFLHNS